MNNRLGEQLRAQAARMMAAAKKLLEAAEVLEESNMGISDKPVSGQSEMPLHVVRTIRREKRSQKDWILGVLTDPSTPLSRAEIFDKLHEAGIMLDRDKGMGAISTLLTRMSKDGKVTNKDGKWMIKKEGA